ncbi:protein snakeskin [Cimex lectularius]|uniref:Protein snakeskin n=1 Tax=Cimex lectularius TaxID=79782 RepID=A0A8I6S4Y8_CIMLE|nr:protein snakeskin [Cimex lectularius]
MDMETIITIFIKVIKLVINLIVIFLYRYGYSGQFLGIGGTWNLNEEKDATAEVVASGVLVGFFIYTSVILMAFCFGTTKHKASVVDIIMNIVGTIMFVAVGGVALHYWAGYQNMNHFQPISTEKQVGFAVGSLCIIEGAVYLIDTVLTFFHIVKKNDLF